jgi:anti-sigma B factor antagonist
MPKGNRSVTKKTIKPGKEIVASIVQSLREQILSSLEHGVKEITIDLNGVETIDSAGLGLLIAAYNSLKGVGGSLKIKNASEKINKFFQTTQLDKYFEAASPA